MPVAQVTAYMQRRSRQALELISSVAPVGDQMRILEVGCGSRGLVFYWERGSLRVGIDPLAAHYATLFPWHRRVSTCAAAGEALPFASGAFDIVLCDNVIDHAERPEVIVQELARVLRPGGTLYFTVNVHHPIYRVASWAYGASRAVGSPVEIGPFADHTVHLTLGAARRLVHDLPVRVWLERDGVVEARALARQTPPRHLGDRLKRLFFKNARYEAVAVKRQA